MIDEVGGVMNNMADQRHLKEREGGSAVMK